jgi:hypothetical protein
MIAQTRAVNMASGGGGGGGGGSAAAGWPGAAAAGDPSLTADDAEYGTMLVEDVKVGWVGNVCALPLGRRGRGGAESLRMFGCLPSVACLLPLFLCTTPSKARP